MPIDAFSAESNPVKIVFYAPTIFNEVCGWEEGGGGEHIVSPLSVRTSVQSICLVRPIRPVRNTNGFRAISFEKMVYWIEILYTGI